MRWTGQNIFDMLVQIEHLLSYRSVGCKYASNKQGIDAVEIGIIEFDGVKSFGPKGGFLGSGHSSDV